MEGEKELANSSAAAQQYVMQERSKNIGLSICPLLLDRISVTEYRRFCVRGDVYVDRLDTMNLSGDNLGLSVTSHYFSI